MSVKFPKLPLIESILEVRWALQKPQFGSQPIAGEFQPQIDPHYKFLLGRFLDRISSEYPEYEPLPTASLPEEMIPHTVQHRFRRGKADWPLIQIGPGILTVNETKKYDWGDFCRRCIDAVHILFAAHPKPSELKIESLLLRYVNAVDFDFKKESAFCFFSDKMRIPMQLPEDLFNTMPIDSKPISFSSQSTFVCRKPAAGVTLKLDTAHSGEKPVIRWETVVESARGDVPVMPAEFSGWIESAHCIHDDWFFKLTAGELQTTFQ